MPRSQETQSDQPDANQEPQRGSTFANEMLNTTNATDQQRRDPPVKRLADMTPQEKWGLQGLRAQLPGGPDHNPFIMGMDLDTLGIDFSR